MARKAWRSSNRLWPRRACAGPSGYAVPLALIVEALREIIVQHLPSSEDMQGNGTFDRRTEQCARALLRRFRDDKDTSSVSPDADPLALRQSYISAAMENADHTSVDKLNDLSALGVGNGASVRLAAQGRDISV